MFARHRLIASLCGAATALAAGASAATTLAPQGTIDTRG